MKYRIFLPVYLLLFVTITQAQKKLPDHSAISLDGQWQFQTDSANVGETQHWYAVQQPAFADHLSVPGNWNTENRYAAYTGKGWYKKTVWIPASLKGKCTRLYFEGVYNLAKVWVNGQFVTENNLGYLQFGKDISRLLCYGSTNTIVVSADNHFKVGALWNWGGIRRPVKLLINEPVYIGQHHVTPRVNLLRHTARLTFDLPLINTANEDASLSGGIEILRQGRSLQTIPFKTTVKANQTGNQLLETRLNAGEVWLWNLDDPNLYDYKITLYRAGRLVDAIDGRFGLRVIELDKDKKQLRLNGKVIRPLGFNLVPDDRTTGNTLPLWRIKEDIDLMKSLGAGMARMSHVPYHQELLDYLDEKGMLICEEIPVWGDHNSMVKTNNPVTNEWLRRMIADHYNHPCIMGWSVGNEIGKNKEVMAYTDSAIALVKRLDTTRLGVTVSYTGQNPVDPLQLSDIGFMNSYGRNIGRQADRIHAMHPESTLFLSEFGWGQLNEDLTADFPIQGIMDSISMKPFLIGASLWTFNDYRSTYKDTKEPSQNRPWGIVDVARQKKVAFYAYRRANKPVRTFQVIAVPGGNAVGKGLDVRVNIAPRAKFDLPAYELDHYRVVLKLTDKSGQLLAGDFSTLPDIHPGDASLTVALHTGSTRVLPFKATVSLVSRQDYVLYDTVIFFQKPLVPKVVYAAAGLTQLAGDKVKHPVTQIRYEKDGSATTYKLRYRADGQLKESPVTTANYINIVDSGVARLTNIELIAVNNAGKTISPVAAIKNDKLLPPLIRYTEAADGAFFTEVETAADDSRFIIQVTKRSGDYHQAATTVAGTKGAIKISALTNGKGYFYRVKHLTSGGDQSGWSEEHKVTPDGGRPPFQPLIRGIIRRKGDVILCFEPVKKATGYELRYKNEQEKNWHRELINASQIDQYQFKLSRATGKIYLKLAAIGQSGKSVYTTYTSAGL